MYEPHLITPFEKSGLNLYYKPYLIGDEAFPTIMNAYPWRGTVKKREGYTLLAALPGGDSPVQGLKNYISPSTLAESLIGFSLTKSYLYNTSTAIFNDITFIAYPTGGAAPVTGAAFSWSNGPDDFFWTSNFQASMWTTNNLVADHIKYWNGTAGSVGVSGGWSTFQPTIDAAPTTLNAALIVLPYKGVLVALNTTEGSSVFQNRARWSQFGTAYAGAAPPVAIALITPGATTQITTSAPHGLTTGDNVSFFGITGTDAAKLNGVNTVATRIDDTNFTVPITTAALNNVGFSQLLGNPPPPFVNDINAWRTDIPGKGGFADADTSERIVSAGIVKDVLIVFFQRSTWRLTFSGNFVQPFFWERLNTQFGAQATYSQVQFDDVVLAFSNYGWIAADTNDVARIDQNIPDNAFAFEVSDLTYTGMKRVQAIRDMYRQYAYFTYQPEAATSATQIYAYDYLNKHWAIFTPTVPIRTFGYYHELNDLRWQDMTSAWEDYNAKSDTWGGIGGGNDGFPYIVGGDAAGNVYTMFEFENASATDNGTNFTYTITTKRFNPYFGEGHKCRVGYVDLYFTDIPGGEITFQHFVNDYDPTGAPFNGLSREVALSNRATVNVSTITTGATTTVTTVANHDLVTGQNVIFTGLVGSIGAILNNLETPITFISSTSFSVAVDTINTAYIAGTGAVYSNENAIGESKYTRIFLNVTANFHQFVITLSPAQLLDSVKGVAQLELQAINIWTRKAARLKG